MEIIKLLSAVMADVGGVGKNERNAHQGFQFRGIDAVVNAVSPALRKHGVVVVPEVLNVSHETVEVGAKRTQQASVHVTVAYRFYAPDGSNVTATVAAESMDSGDKATAKAMSVAFRIALLQALCLPTDEPDPDSETYVRSDKVQYATDEQVARFIKACGDAGLDHDRVADHAGVDLTQPTTDDMISLRRSFDALKEGK